MLDASRLYVTSVALGLFAIASAASCAPSPHDSSVASVPTKGMNSDSNGPGHYILIDDAVRPITGSTFSLDVSHEPVVVFSSLGVATASVTIQVECGSARVESLRDSVWDTIGVIDAQQATTFEGLFRRIRIVALTDGTRGRTTAHMPAATPHSERVIGSGIISLQPSTACRVYASSGSTYRGIVVFGEQSDISIRTSAESHDLATVCRGDGSYLGSSAREYWLCGSGRVKFAILDKSSSGDRQFPIAVRVSGAQSRRRVVTSDGRVQLRCMVANLGPGDVLVHSESSPDLLDAGSTSLSVGERTLVNGAIQRIDIEFGHDASAVIVSTTAQSEENR